MDALAPSVSTSTAAALPFLRPAGNGGRVYCSGRGRRSAAAATFCSSFGVPLFLSACSSNSEGDGGGVGGPPCASIGGADGGDETSERESAKQSSDEVDDVERALGMDGGIPRTSGEFLRRVSSRAYGMRRDLQQTLDSISYDVLDSNPWRGNPKTCLCSHSKRKPDMDDENEDESEVERELGLLFSRGKRQSDVGNKSKSSSTGFKFRMLVEDIREGVLVFEDEQDAAKYCDLLQGGGQGCEGIAELEASSVFDICQKMKALAVLFRRGERRHCRRTFSSISALGSALWRTRRTSEPFPLPPQEEEEDDLLR